MRKLMMPILAASAVLTQPTSGKLPSSFSKY
jgi:hypothetical protein